MGTTTRNLVKILTLSVPLFFAVQAMGQRFSCTEDQAFLRHPCSELSATQTQQIMTAVTQLMVDCPIVQKQTILYLGYGRIRIADKIPRKDLVGIATSRTDRRIVVLSRDAWPKDQLGLSRVLRHEMGHMLYPSGAYAKTGTYYTTEEMARSHGTCFRHPLKSTN